MEYILSYLSRGKWGFKPRICLVEVIQAIFYRLKIGCQWREVPWVISFGAVAAGSIFSAISINGARMVRSNHLLEGIGVDMLGVFLNADAGFDGEEFRQYCSVSEIQANIKAKTRNARTETNAYRYFDEELYRRRTVIEHANA